jgi:phosphatidylglycerol:prolipoprotein diacylglycerol transferase
VGAVFARGRSIPLRRFLDVFAPALALGYAVAMVGALLHGLYLGRPSGVPWAVQMLLDRRHPTQLYLLLASLGTYYVLRAQERQLLSAGSLFFLWLLLHGLARVAVEFFVESVSVLGPLTLAHLTNIAAALVGLIGLIVSARRPAAEPAAPAVTQDAS